MSFSFGGFLASLCVEDIVSVFSITSIYATVILCCNEYTQLWGLGANNQHVITQFLLRSVFARVSSCPCSILSTSPGTINHNFRISFPHTNASLFPVLPAYFTALHIILISSEQLYCQVFNTSSFVLRLQSVSSSSHS